MDNETATVDPVEQVTPEPESTGSETVTPEQSVDTAEREAFDKLREQFSPPKDEGQPETTTDEEPTAEQASEGAESSTEEQPADEPVSLDLANNEAIKGLMDELHVSEDGAIDIALTAFRRDGALDDEAIESLFERNPEKFVEGGLKRAKVQRDTDRLGTEFHKLRQSVTQRQAPASQDDAQQGTEAQVEQPASVPPSLDEALKALAADEIGEDLAPHIKQAVEAVREESTSLIQQQQQVIENMRFAEIDTQLELSRMRMTREYPELDKPEVQDAVLSKYDILAEAGQHDSVRAAYEEAVHWQLGKKTTDELKARMLSRVQQRKAGKPRPSTPTGEPRKLTPEENERQLFFRLRQEKGFQD